MRKSRVTPEVTRLIKECIDRPGTGEAFVEQARQELRRRCKLQPWFLIYYVLGYKDIDSNLHKDMCERWVRRVKRLFTLWQVPRGHLKTSLWTIGMSIWEILLDPNLRILIINAVLGNAQDMMGEINTHFKTNPVFRWLWPEYCLDLCQDDLKKKLCKATIDRIDVPCGNRMGKKEGNFECLGVEMSLVSKHYDLFMFDDLVNDVNTATTEYRNKVWTWFLNSWQLRHSPSESRIRDIGTPWHLDDVHSRIINGEKKRRKSGRAPKWLIYRRSATESTGLSTRKEPIWPERFTLPILDDLRIELGSYIYSCQYDCNPISPENALFQEKYLQPIKEEDIPFDVVNFAAVDLAIEGQDFTVVVVASFDSEGKMYVRQIVRGHIHPLELMDTLRTLDRLWKLRRIGIETTGFQKVLVKFYKDYALEKKFHLPWVEMPRGKQHKLKRFLALQPLVERGMFHYVEGIQHEQEMLGEMATVTLDHLPTHDDILDCIADLQQIFYNAPVEVLEEGPPPGSIDAIFGSLEGSRTNRVLESAVVGGRSWRE